MSDYLRALCAVAAREAALLKKRRIAKTVDYQGITVRIDRPQGHVQRGRDAKGVEWERTYKTDYGYIPGTSGGDGDGLDVYLGPDRHAPLAYWVRQHKASGEFDEFKLMLGFVDRRSAKAMWSAHTPERFYGGIATTAVAMVKALLGVEPVAFAKALRVDDERPRSDRSLEALRKAASAAALLVEAGPPEEWSGAVAGALGDERRARVTALWNALSQEDRGRVQRAFEESFDADNGRTHPIVAELEARHADLAKVLELTPVERAVAVADRVRVLKAGESEEQRYVLGVVLEPDVVDAQGDTYDAETIRRAAWLYMMEYRNRGLQHEQLVNHAVQLVESYVAPTDLDVQGSKIRAGTWLAGLYVADDELWQMVKTGKLGGLSIGGVATKVDPETGAVIAPPPEKSRFQPDAPT